MLAHSRHRTLLSKGLCVYCGRKKSTSGKVCADCRQLGAIAPSRAEGYLQDKVIDPGASRRVMLACWQPILAPGVGRFDDTIVELESPDGPYIEDDGYVGFDRRWDGGGDDDGISPWGADD